MLAGPDHRIDGLTQHVISVGGGLRVAGGTRTPGDGLEERCEPPEDRWEVGCLRVDEKQGQGGRRQRRHQIGGANVASRNVGERQFPCLERGDVEGEANDREAIT